MCRCIHPRKKGGVRRKCAAKKGVRVSKHAPSQCSSKDRVGRAHVQVSDQRGTKPLMEAHAYDPPHLGI